MSPEFRRKAVLIAAQKYADAQQRLKVYLDGSPNGTTDTWPEEFTRQFDQKIREVEVAKELLLRLASKL
jgi:hypothetical protein